MPKENRLCRQRDFPSWDCPFPLRSVRSGPFVPQPNTNSLVCCLHNQPQSSSQVLYISERLWSYAFSLWCPSIRQYPSIRQGNLAIARTLVREESIVLQLNLPNHHLPSRQEPYNLKWSPDAPPVRVQETSPLPLPLASNVLHNEFSFSDILISNSFVISRTERPDYLTINVSLPPRCCLRLPSRQRKSPWVSVCRMRPVNSRLSADRAYNSEHLRVRVSFVRFCLPVRFRCKRHFGLLLFRVFLSVLLG